MGIMNQKSLARSAGISVLFALLFCVVFLVGSGSAESSSVIFGAKCIVLMVLYVFLKAILLKTKCSCNIPVYMVVSVTSLVVLPLTAFMIQSSFENPLPDLVALISYLLVAFAVVMTSALPLKGKFSNLPVYIIGRTVLVLMLILGLFFSLGITLAGTGTGISSMLVPVIIFLFSLLDDLLILSLKPIS